MKARKKCPACAWTDEMQRRLGREMADVAWRGGDSITIARLGELLCRPRPETKIEDTP